MRKIVILLLVLFAGLSTASAQFIKGGFKGGVNINSSKLEFNSDFIDAAKNKAGYHIGAFTRVSLLGILYVQGDLLYVRNSYEHNITSGGSLRIKENRLSIPTVAGVNFLFLRAYVGPRFDINLGTKVSKSIGDGNAMRAEFDNRWIGYQAGLGLDLFKKISIDLNYNGYFKSPKNKFVVGDDSYTSRVRSRQWWISVGYYFGGGNKVKTNKNSK